MNLKVAILQMKSLNRQCEKSTGIILQKMEEAAAAGADILLLPEAFLTGYELPMTNEEALADDNPYLAQICRAAAGQKRCSASSITVPSSCSLRARIRPTA